MMANVVDREVDIPVNGSMHKGDLVIPENMRGMVLFSHGTGSSRKSPRNMAVAAFLNLNGMGTLLFDLLSAEEDKKPYMKFDIAVMTERLVRVTGWLSERADMKGVPMGYFGVNTGAASAMCAAVQVPSIAAVVSRGGRSDLAVDKFIHIKCPVLFIAGELDHEVLGINHTVMLLMHGITKLETVIGATHLFPEKGKMGKVARLALEWFKKYLVAA